MKIVQTLVFAPKQGLKREGIEKMRATERVPQRDILILHLRHLILKTCSFLISQISGPSSGREGSYMWVNKWKKIANSKNLVFSQIKTLKILLLGKSKMQMEAYLRLKHKVFFIEV